ncbi:hypothetical protein Anas_05327 [Armadillidium nasatum]|uniref:Uncharacterized protein n=1 Tax=Armadillidium nasatum TaxID=96803 RepID=A0A5N5SNK5_9CRUS|nr:hypothetical protein Anas_05327 [Armadillidium nasatum]
MYKKIAIFLSVLNIFSSSGQLCPECLACAEIGATYCIGDGRCYTPIIGSNNLYLANRTCSSLRTNGLSLILAPPDGVLVGSNITAWHNSSSQRKYSCNYMTIVAEVLDPIVPIFTSAVDTNRSSDCEDNKEFFCSIAQT